MSTTIDPSQLHQHWQLDEETASEIIYRPAGFYKGLRRPRPSFELKPDGCLIQIGNAPDDKRTIGQGSWKLSPDNILSFYEGGQTNQPQKSLKIDSLSADKLVVKKQDG